MPLELINLILLVMFVYLMLNIRYLKQYQVVPLLLVVTVNLIAELGAFYITKARYENGSYWIYNFSLPVELIGYGLLYKKLFRHKRFRHVINAAFVLIPLLTVLSFIWHKGIFLFNTAVAIFGSLFLLLTTLYFFIQLFQFDYFHQNPLKQFYFWLSVGLLLCYLGALTYLSNINRLLEQSWLQAFLQSLNFYLNCFLYVCIYISVKCLKRHPHSQLQSF